MLNWGERWDAFGGHAVALCHKVLSDDNPNSGFNVFNRKFEDYLMTAGIIVPPTR